VTFEERGGETLVVIRELYPSKKALDDAMASGSISWSGEQFEQLDQVLAAVGASLEQS
jgi:flavorubredoxin